MNMPTELKIYPHSIHTGSLNSDSSSSFTCYLARNEDTGERLLGVRFDSGSFANVFSEPVMTQGDEHFFALNAGNAAVLRQVFAWLNPIPLEPAEMAEIVQQPSFGFGDRLGLATPGHIQALRALKATASPILPIFAQQSVRENTRTGRTPQQVLDEAMWGVFQEGWTLPWGADADHLKQTSDLLPFVQAGYSFYTIDPGDYVDPQADTDPLDVIQTKLAYQAWEEFDSLPTTPTELVGAYRSFCQSQGLKCDEDYLNQAALRAIAKYGQAILHMVKMYQALLDLKVGGFDFEVSVDETESPTSILEHFYIASTLKNFGVRTTSLALRLPGRFEKGVDFIGDLAALETELEQHVAVMQEIGGYKISLHSGSDKFSLYPLLARHAGCAVHVKTAGTSYLEALRVAASLEPALFCQILELARQRYSVDRQTYHVSAEEQRLPPADTIETADLPALLDDFHVRQALHVTFGSALAQYGDTLKAMLKTHPDAYNQVLLSHFRRHLEPLIPM